MMDNKELQQRYDELQRLYEQQTELNNKLSRSIIVERTRRGFAQEQLTILLKRLFMAYELLNDHHTHHMLLGSIGVPDGGGGWIEIDNGAEYVDSSLYDRTMQTLITLEADTAFKAKKKIVEAAQLWHTERRPEQLTAAVLALERVKASERTFPRGR